jgi:hypothetical protein
VAIKRMPFNAFIVESKDFKEKNEKNPENPSFFLFL